MPTAVNETDAVTSEHSEPAVPASRPPTLQDVADRAGFSRALVSIVIRGVPGASETTRQRVLEVADQLGYRPDGRARLLAAGRSKLIGVTLGLDNPFHSDVAAGIYQAAEASGYQVVLSAVTASRTAQQAVETLLDYRCEAAVLVGPLVPVASLLALTERLPVVVVGQSARSRAADVVRVPAAVGLGLAVDHLVSLGHRRITHVDGGRAPGAVERRTGFTSAMRRHGLAGTATIVRGGGDEEAGAAAARELVDGGLPTAVITYNDACAVGLLDMFVRLGVTVPGDVSVVGYDDSKVARLSYLRLTTVSQDGRRLAAVAVERLIERLDRQPDGRRATSELKREVLVPPRLVVRATTAAVRQPG
ncbi:LacI family DNA-binding transcriptional regulator [Jatrophihabitans lederbergiae]|uniref:LacI family DNA-binding transcriptional regulator n=1 Tax=Jatrophihabitans lederbergiae TaxID=3075547 RepID=A0ABU2J6H1_9ACTN|nr:LacI family DNA-binding transcriptional regulator [Jatrophihabitans sp. DSM 44399]MDT0260590.1 LacI family DNA-binding transcriptional regulator [Jatrophihabitans sp. DSM 44399]